MSYEAEVSLKLCIFGDGGVGVTSLTNRFINNTFNMDLMMTLGFNILVHYMTVDGLNISLEIWDIGGDFDEKQFKFLLPIYSKGGMNGGLFMFDLTRQNSLDSVEEWINSFRAGLDENERDIPILLIGGKSDLVEERVVSANQARDIKNQFKFTDYVECSALTGENVKKVFELISKAAINDLGKNINNK